MTTSISHLTRPATLASPRSTWWLLFSLLAVFAFLAFPDAVMAQDGNYTSNIFSDTPTDGSDGSNIQAGFSGLLWWVYNIFKVIAIIVVGWAMLEIRSGELTKGFFGVLSAIGMFFAPALVELARNLGGVASNNGG